MRKTSRLNGGKGPGPGAATPVPGSGGSASGMHAGVASTSLNAAALQDHFARTLKLDLHLGKPRLGSKNSQKKKNHSKPPRQRLGQRSRGGGSSEVGRQTTTTTTNNNEEEAEVAHDQEEHSPWTCEQCTLLNQGGPKRCSACGSSRRAQLRALDKSDQRTLAQKLGLLAGPPAKLSEGDWKQLERDSESRKDSFQPCSICRQDFGADEQLLLSCSHVFHRVCLESYERFVRSKERCCPLCRKADYEKRGVKLGAKAHRLQSAEKMQAQARGFLQRARFRRLLSDFYGSGQGDEEMRHRFFAKKLTHVTDRLMRNISAKDDSLDRLFRELDDSVRDSRRVFDGAQAVDWDAVVRQLTEREGAACECAICMTEVRLAAEEEPGAGELGARESSREPGAGEAALLQCSHVFHVHCIEAFENFNVDKSARQCCPMCRSGYVDKHLLNFAS